ncbi:MAG TPA: glycoside hydrolase family 3 N-terminal domain-containing protein, partial [Terriglobia bacterium]|nr:glycoside hydrolase family 3 N-terminal domain-containing protein [Terriglobia bacterium]
MMQHRKTSQLSDRQLLTGLLILEVNDLRWSRGLEKLLHEWQPAGVLLGERHLRDPDATAELLGKIGRATNDPPMLAIRESGGRFSALRNFHLRVPSPRAVGRQGASASRKLGDLIGAALKLIGFNTTFGPSLDLSAPYSDLLLDDRLFSSYPEVVALCGRAFIHGLRRRGIAAAPGHFPGISDTTTDPATKHCVADKSMAEMWREDLIPFRKLAGELPLVVT